MLIIGNRRSVCLKLCTEPGAPASGELSERSRIRAMFKSPVQTRRSVWKLLLIAALLAIGYACSRTLRFEAESLNFISACAFYVVPFLAIRPVLRLPRWPRRCGLILLAPLLLLSSFLLLFKLVVNGLLGSTEHTETLQKFQQGSSTIELQRYEYGGAVGVRGLNLEQRRLIVPGLYVVKTVDFFDYAHEGTLSVEEPYTVKVHAKGSYDDSKLEVDRGYSLKPWVYF
jgi:hypothetical protein